ncbi:nucleotide kinase domain-containing protein [Roseateles sp. DC23W]|uniref:Nucleotide kinase domain-containing protein n=1 Tax=Pelomonas dachongensis TaxID=3299029 RepID=A0ABW7EGV5_9BURK
MRKFDWTVVLRRPFLAVLSESLSPLSETPSTGRLTVFVRRTPPTPSKAYATYWKFAAARQALYLKRFSGGLGPWTEDPILRVYKFTNAYRAADRVSQYLISQIIYNGAWSPKDVLFRTILFKLFNKIETWELLSSQFGELKLASFDVPKFDAVLSRAISSGARIYSAAYIMPNAPRLLEGSYKHRTHLDLLKWIFLSGIGDKILDSKSMRECYELLLGIPSVGPFLAYQYAIDLNYSTNFCFSEDDFVQPGPGALNGIKKCFSDLGEYSPADAIRWVADRQAAEFAERGLSFNGLWGRKLHLIDCQNLFCEVDKYARVAHPELSELTGRARIKQKYSPTGEMPRPMFPPKWKLEVSLAI